MRFGIHFSKRGGRYGAIGLALAAILVLSAGPSCDTDAANTFRKTATGPIGDGVKTITDGIIDGMIAAIENAGDDDEQAEGN